MIVAYIDRYGGEIVGVNLTRRLNVPLAMLEMAMMLDGEPYRLHPIGGGLVAASSYVPDTVSVPRDVMIGPDTHVLTNRGMAGQTYVKGNFHNPNQVSQYIDDDGLKLLDEQRQMGVIGRVLEIERRKRMADAAAVVDSLF